VNQSLDTTPGRTSSIQLPGGTMTLQTELRGDPLEVVTIVDFRGKVMRRKSRVLTDEEHDDLELVVRHVHADIERGIRVSLESVRKARDTSAASSGQAAVEPSTSALLFVMSADALGRGDLPTAASLLEAVAQLLPDDTRVRSLLRYVKSCG